MVVRRRLRSVLVPLAAYVVAAGVVAYFVQNANIGNRGLAAKRALKIQIHQVNTDFQSVKEERAEWDRRLALLRADHIDRDLLEERGRMLLGRVGRNDIVIVTP